MTINYDTCCPEILAEIGAILQEIEEIEVWADVTRAEITNKLFPYFTLINGFPGQWVNSPPGGYFPVLAELVGRITSFGIGWGEWWFFMDEDCRLNLCDRTDFCLSSDPGQCRVTLNGVQLTPGDDYAITGSRLVLEYRLEYGDLLIVKSYGVAP